MQHYSHNGQEVLRRLETHIGQVVVGASQELDDVTPLARGLETGEHGPQLGAVGVGVVPVDEGRGHVQVARAPHVQAAPPTLGRGVGADGLVLPRVALLHQVTGKV